MREYVARIKPARIGWEWTAYRMRATHWKYVEHGWSCTERGAVRRAARYLLKAERQGGKSYTIDSTGVPL